MVGEVSNLAYFKTHGKLTLSASRTRRVFRSKTRIDPPHLQLPLLDNSVQLSLPNTRQPSLSQEKGDLDFASAVQNFCLPVLE